MPILSPSQSVNDVRFIDGNGSALITAGPGTTVASLSNTPSTITWTAPV